MKTDKDQFRMVWSMVLRVSRILQDQLGPGYVPTREITGPNRTFEHYKRLVLKGMVVKVWFWT